MHFQMKFWEKWLLIVAVCATLCSTQFCTSDGVCDGEEEMEAAAGCPPLVRPSDIHFLVINLDRSTGRLERMREAFRNAGLPEFERVPGVEVKEELLGSSAYPVPRLTTHLKVAGLVVAHRRLPITGRVWLTTVHGRWVIVRQLFRIHVDIVFGMTCV